MESSQSIEERECQPSNLPMLSKKEIGLLVKKAREIKSEKIGKRYSQHMLADDINKSQSYIGDIESGRTYPSVSMLCNIADACGVSLNFFHFKYKKAQSFGEWIAAQRISVGFDTKKELAVIAGIDPSTLTLIEGNKTKPTPDTLKKIAPHIHVDLVELLVRTGHMDMVTVVDPVDSDSTNNNITPYEVFETVSRRAEQENTEEARIKKEETYLSLTYNQAFQIVDEAAELLRCWLYNMDRVQMERSQKGAVLMQVRKANELAQAIETALRYNY